MKPAENLDAGGSHRQEIRVAFQNDLKCRPDAKPSQSAGPSELAGLPGMFD
jgi:hypothetical protein